MSNSTDKDLLVEALLQERDELYLELSRLRDIADGTRERQLDEMIRQKDAELQQKEDILRKKDAVIEKKVTGKWPSEEGYRKKLEKLRKRFEACSTGNVPTATLLKKKNEVN